MKRSLFLSIIVCLCLAACIPQALAQKQSHMEKLLKYLNSNDTAKWKKNREKLNEETKAYYADDLSLLDVLYQLWNKPNEPAATAYFGCYEKAEKDYFPDICEEVKIPLSEVRNRSDRAIISLLEASNNKISFSRALMDSVRSTGYPADSVMQLRIKSIRELALMEEMMKSPSLSIYQAYMKEYPDGKFIPQINAAENKRLYLLLKNTPDAANFKAFFDDADMQKYFKEKGPRPFLAEARTMYDEYLFQSIDSLKKEGNATAIRQIIDDYKNTPYLTTTARTHLDDLEYLSEKADFELLKPTIVNAESLGKLEQFLKTHKYKEFRDQANALRAQFILQTIVSTPTGVKYYNQGKLMKSCETDSTGNVSTTYTYNDSGKLVMIKSVTEKNGNPVSQVQTSMLYDPQGHCIFEVKTNPITKTDFYRRSRRIGIDGSIESDSLKYADGRLSTSNYNKQGLLTETKVYNKNGELETYTVNKYDDNNRLTESHQQNMLFVNSPDQVLSQKESYQYDKYGYLTRIIYQRIFGNSQKTSGFMTCLYDEYGNRIDGASYYEYDNTGQWICRSSGDTPYMERIQYIYK